MDLKKLEYFLTIVKKQSFTAAAYDCALSQPALSQHMKTLERELQVKLFVRQGRGFALTGAGRLLARAAPDLLLQMQELTQQLRQADQGAELMQVGILTYLRDPHLDTLIAQILARQQLKCALHRLSHEGIYHGLSLGRLDFAVSDQRRIFDQLSYVNHKIKSVPWQIECSCSLFPGRNKIEADQLPGELPCAVVCESEHYQAERAFLRDKLLIGEAVFTDSAGRTRILARRGRAVRPVLELGQTGEEEEKKAEEAKKEAEAEEKEEGKESEKEKDRLHTLTLTRGGRPICSRLCLFAKKPLPPALQAVLPGLLQALRAL